MGKVWTSMNVFWAQIDNTRSKNLCFLAKITPTLAITSGFALQSGIFGPLISQSSDNRTHTRTITQQRRMFWYRWCKCLFWISWSQNSRKYTQYHKYCDMYWNLEKRGSFLQNFPQSIYSPCLLSVTMFILNRQPQDGALEYDHCSIDYSNHFWCDFSRKSDVLLL